MKQNNKSLGRFKLALLVLCTIFVFITAAMSVGFLGAKNSKAANAYTADNKSNFVQVYDGKDIFDASSGSFRIDGMEALFKAISGSSTYSGMSNWMSETVNSNVQRRDYINASDIRMINEDKDLLVKVGSEVWTVACMSNTEYGDIYVVLWLAESTQTSSYNDLAGILGTASNLLAPEHPRWYNFVEKMDKYMEEKVPDLSFYTPRYKKYSVVNGSNKLNVADASYVYPVVDTHVTAEHVTLGFWGLSEAQRSNTINTWTPSTSYGGATGPAYITASGGYAFHNVEGSGEVEDYVTVTQRIYHAVRPFFKLNLTKAYESCEVANPTVNPKVTYTGKLYTSGKMPEITTSEGDTAGAIKWKETKLTAGTNEYNWTFTPAISAYKTVTGKYTLTVLPVEFDRVTVSFDPADNVIYTNTPLNTLKDYLTVTAYNNDGSFYGTATDPDTEEKNGLIASADYELYGALTEGTCNLTLAFGGKTFPVQITGVQDADEITFDKLIITKQPENVNYFAYGKFNTTGMEVTARYSDGDRIVTGYKIVYPENEDGTQRTHFLYGDKKVTISFTDGSGVTQTADVEVTVAKAKSEVTPVVNISGTLYTSHNMPQITNISGGTRGEFAWDEVDGKSAELIAGKNAYAWTFTPADANYETVKGEYVLTVEEVALDRITVVYEPETDDSGSVKKVYTSAKLSELKNITVKGVNNDGTAFALFDDEGNIPLKECTLSGSLAAGSNVITVSYNGKYTTFTVNGVIAVALESVKAEYPVNAHNIYASYSLDQLKEELTVTAVFNDGSKQVLKHYELINNLGNEDKPELTVKYEGKVFSFTPENFVSDITLTGISAIFEPKEIIYESAAIDSLKPFLKIKLTYDDGSTEIKASSELTGLAIVGDIKAGDDNVLTVTYNSKAATFQVKDVKAKKLTSIKVTFTRPTDGITDKTSLDSLKTSDYLAVKAVYNTGEEVEVHDFNTLTLIGKLTAGASCNIAVKYTDAKTNEVATATINVGEVKLVKSKPVVTPQIVLNEQTLLVEGLALPQISLSSGDTEGTISWKKVEDEDGNSVDPVLVAGKNAYEWTFTPKDSTNYESVSGKYYFTADAVKVERLTVELISAEPVYTETNQDVLKSRFKVIAVYNNGVLKQELSATEYEIYAALKANATCEVVFSFTDKKHYTVTAKSSIFVSTLTGALPVNVIWDGTNRVFEYNGKSQKPSAHFKTSANEEVLLDVKVYKLEKGEYVAVESAVGAGSYKAVAQVPSSGKYALSGLTETFFTVSPKKIVRPVALAGTDYVYTGSECEFLLDGFDASIMSVTGNKQTEAGTYTVTVTITDENYEFAVGDGSTGSLSYVFNIVNPENGGSSDGKPVVVENGGLSTGLLIGIIVAVAAVLLVAVVAIIIALKNKGGSTDDDGFYDVMQEV